MREQLVGMPKYVHSVILLVVMVGLIVGLDVAFFRHHFWERLIVNIGIVLVFIASYSRFLKKP